MKEEKQIAAANNPVDRSSTRPNYPRELLANLEQFGLSINSIAMKIQLPKNISLNDVSRFHAATFNLILKHNRGRDSTQIDSFSGGRKIDLKHILQLDEWVIDPIYLHLGNETNKLTDLFVDGLAPDIAWKFQNLLSTWNQSDPTLFPESRLIVNNMRLSFKNHLLGDIHGFFENILEFDRILSLKDIFSKEELRDLFQDEISISIFKNHLEIYLKKNFTLLNEITFAEPELISVSNNGLLVSDIKVLNSICNILKPKIMVIIDCILNKAEEKGFGNETFAILREKFFNTFMISPIVACDEGSYLQSQIDRIFNTKISTGKSMSGSLESDIDRLHYLRSIANSNITFEELMKTTTKFVHENDLDETGIIENDIFYNPAFLSGIPIIKTRYFLFNFEMFHIRILDLSNTRLIFQPEMKILGQMEYLKTLILNNARASGEFDVLRMKFGELPNLQVLSIRNCGLTKLTRSMFEGGKNIKKIYATGNPFASIEEGIFKDIDIEEFHIDTDLQNEFSTEIKDIIQQTKNNNDARKKHILSSIS